MKWTAEQDDYLRRAYRNANPERIRAELGNRAWNTICTRAMKLGLKRRVKTRKDGKVSSNALLKSLRKYRIRKGLALRDLAKKMGYHETTVAGWESGRNHPKFAALMDWCDALGVCLYPWTVNEPMVPKALSRWASAWDREDPEERMAA